MSNQAITWALETKTAGPATKVLLIALANYANEHGVSYPSIERLASETDQSQASVKRHLTELIKVGLITRTKRGSEAGGRLTNSYTLAMPEARAHFEPKGFGLKSGGVRAQSGGGLGITVEPLTQEPKEPKEYVDPFASFYAIYPKKVGRGQAVKAWKTATKKADAETITEAARDFAVHCNGTDPRFIPHPATWLNGERWLDDDPAEAELLPEWMR